MNSLALNIFDELDRLQREMDHFTGFRWAPRRRVTRASRSWPSININEDTDNIYVDALAPGVNPESLDVSMSGDQLTISGEKKALPNSVASEKIHRSERAGGKFVRSVTLPSEVDSVKIEASYKSGLLKITLPKAEAAKPKKIKVSVV